MTKEIIKGLLDENPFQIVEKSEIITQEDLAVIQELKAELKETFLKSQVFRTRTEMEVSVLDDIKHPTSSSKYWQSVREQDIMFQELVMLSYEYRKNLIEIKKHQRDLAKEKDDLEKELLQIEIEKKNFIARNQEKVAKDRIREIKAWSEIKEKWAQNMTKEELEDVDNHQLISYTQRWLQESFIMGESGSPAERQNLLGQLYSGLKTCQKKGLVEKVLEPFNLNIREQATKFLESGKS